MPTPIEAQARLEIMTQHTVEPTLTSTEISKLMAMFSLMDENGVAPSGPGWVPTYNLRAAAREGWKWKAAKASQLVSTDLDGDRMSANQMFEHCERMVRK